VLKRLKGTPIIRHDAEWAMVYQEHPPFTVLSTRSMYFGTLQKVARFSKFWDLFANSGNFKESWALLARAAAAKGRDSRFWAFWDFCEFLGGRHAQKHGIALLNLVESTWLYLTRELAVEPASAREALVQDYTGNVKRDIPAFLREESRAGGMKAAPQLFTQDDRASDSLLPPRQRRHQTERCPR
jgi:hypothetical protein